jgi:prevent-host-death family protein
MTSVVKSHLARKNWRSLLDQVLKGEDVIIERNGVQVAALIPVDDYMSLLDELEELRFVREAVAEYETWKAKPETAEPWDQVKEDLG